MEEYNCNEISLISQTISIDKYMYGRVSSKNLKNYLTFSLSFYTDSIRWANEAAHNRLHIDFQCSFGFLSSPSYPTGRKLQ